MHTHRWIPRFANMQDSVSGYFSGDQFAITLRNLTGRLPALIDFIGECKFMCMWCVYVCMCECMYMCVNVCVCMYVCVCVCTGRLPALIDFMGEC